MITRSSFIIYLLFHITLVFGQGIDIDYAYNDDKSIDLSYTKDVPGSYSVYIEFTKSDNTTDVSGWYPLPYRSGRLFTLKPFDTNSYIRIAYRTKIVRGILDPKADTTFTYLLPFADQVKTKVNFLRYLGKKYFGQVNPENWKAFQFFSDKPDTVCASRKGIVVKVTKQHDMDTTQYYSYSSRKNQLTIEHADGTFARYEGFNGHQIFVEAGDWVIPGQALGVLSAYDKRGNYQLRFAIFYLLDANTDFESNTSLKERRSQNKYLNPYFMTSIGKTQLTAKTEYTSTIPEAIIIKEMSKKERKKRQKALRLCQ
ncbi:MAG: hypothetical protein JEZ14_16710 [Marinilabiliaceae bacterium]|nr:hypothetical protein [Marinilabiliaceae bacterium]